VTICGRTVSARRDPSRGTRILSNIITPYSYGYHQNNSADL
jgi:hypothetical protein